MLTHGNIVFQAAILDPVMPLERRRSAVVPASVTSLKAAQHLSADFRGFSHQFCGKSGKP
jgi:hypothetical protein